jgi:hypothetical protein
MALLFIGIYIVGFILTACICGPEDADGVNDLDGQLLISLVWPVVVVGLVLLVPVFIVLIINEFRKL